MLWQEVPQPNFAPIGRLPRTESMAGKPGHSDNTVVLAISNIERRTTEMRISLYRRRFRRVKRSKAYKSRIEMQFMSSSL